MIHSIFRNPTGLVFPVYSSLYIVCIKSWFLFSSFWFIWCKYLIHLNVLSLQCLSHIYAVVQETWPYSGANMPPKHFHDCWILSSLNLYLSINFHIFCSFSNQIMYDTLLYYIMYLHIFLTSRIFARFIIVTCKLIDIMKILFAHFRARFSKSYDFSMS